MFGLDNIGFQVKSKGVYDKSYGNRIVLKVNIIIHIGIALLTYCITQTQWKAYNKVSLI